MALAGTYDADGDFVEAYPEDQRKIPYINLAVFLGECCLLMSLVC